MSRTSENRGPRVRADVMVLGVLSVALVVTAVASWRWRPNADAAIMLYASLLQGEFGKVLYRDVFDMNAPGAHLAFRAIGWLSGYRDHAVRLVDLASLSVLACTTAAALRAWGWRVSWAAAVLTGLLYLGAGDAMSLQREFLLLTPTAVMLAIVLTGPREARSAGVGFFRALAAGACVGVASTVKPQAALFLLVIVSAATSRPDGRERFTRAALTLVPAVLGVGIVWALVAGWLWSQGALVPFLDMAQHYWPLYDALTRRPYRAVEGLSRLRYLVEGYLSGFAGWRALWLAAALGSVALLRGRGVTAARPPVLPLAVLAGTCLLFPGITGKFWEYHWLPFGYAAMLLASLSLSDVVCRAPRRRAAAAVLLLAVAGLPARAWIGDARRDAELARVDALAALVAQRVSPGDTVQPLDWTGLAQHAMLRARTPLATRILEDVHVHHHAGDPYIEQLRTGLLDDLARRRPRLVIEVDARGWASGPSGRASFPQLDRVLRTRYRIVERQDGYTIHERVAADGPGPGDALGDQPTGVAARRYTRTTSRTASMTSSTSRSSSPADNGSERVRSPTHSAFGNAPGA